MSESNDLLNQHGGSLAASAIGAVVLALQWLLKREVKRRDEAVQDHETRLRAMENDRATKSDISGIYKQIDSLRTRSEERHLEILDRLP